MRERLTVSGTLAQTTTTSASAVAGRSTIRTEPVAPAAITCWRSISCERGHTGAALDQRDVKRLGAHEQVEGERGADAAAAAHDGDPRAHVASRVIVRHLAWTD